MQLAGNVIDVWAFRRIAGETRFLLLYTSVEKAERYFNGGRFWQIPSGVVEPHEPLVAAVARVLGSFGLAAKTIWAGEHAYVIYNRRFEQMQIIGVYAAEVEDAPVRMDPAEHAQFAWLPFEACLERVHYRGLKDGLRSVHDYITAPAAPARELCLWEAPRAAGDTSGHPRQTSGAAAGATPDVSPPVDPAAPDPAGSPP